MNEDADYDYWSRFDYLSELYASDIESMKDEGNNYLLSEEDNENL